MLKIELLGIKFHARHGVYPEEKITGNFFMVDITVFSKAVPTASDNISDTVDYVSLYAIAEKRMKNTVNLLETIASQILDDIFVQFPEVQKAKVAVGKQNPPIGGDCREAKVTVKKKKSI